MDYYPFNKDAYDQWVIDQGDATLRLDYPLSKDSVVLDLGGFKGDWSSSVYDMYGCNMYIFEPVTKYFVGIKRRFLKNDKIKIFKYCLGSKNYSTEISLLGDSTSIFLDSAQRELIEIADIHYFIKFSGIRSVDLIKINIEGGEYDLLETILESSMQTCFGNIQVQFHRFIPNCKERRDRIRDILSKTHQLTYDYEFIWENWKLKPDISISSFSDIRP